MTNSDEPVGKHSDAAGCSDLVLQACKAVSISLAGLFVLLAAYVLISFFAQTDGSNWAPPWVPIYFLFVLLMFSLTPIGITALVAWILRKRSD